MAWLFATNCGICRTSVLGRKRTFNQGLPECPLTGVKRTLKTGITALSKGPLCARSRHSHPHKMVVYTDKYKISIHSKARLFDKVNITKKIDLDHSLKRSLPDTWLSIEGKTISRRANGRSHQQSYTRRS